MKNTEELMARVMNYLAEKFKNELILKGGMLLRLLNSPRATQDLDYCWIRTQKRTLFAEQLKGTLEKLEGIRVTEIKANSRGIFIDIEDANSGGLAKIEINVIAATHRPPQPMTTAQISTPYLLKPQIVTAMDLAEAFSHKIAAAMERDLARDLYDLMQWEPLTLFDETTLRDRLSRLEIGRAKPKKVSREEAAELLRKRLDSLTEKKIKEELAANLPKEYLVGMLNIIRASVGRVIQRMELME